MYSLGERGVEEKYNRTAYSIVEGVSLLKKKVEHLFIHSKILLAFTFGEGSVVWVEHR